MVRRDNKLKGRERFRTTEFSDEEYVSGYFNVDLDEEDEVEGSNGNYKLNRFPKRKNGWKSSKKVTQHCVIAEDMSITIEMPSEILSDVLYLAKEMETEWLGYFKGEKDSTEKDKIVYKVNELIFPEQEVTMASVVVKEEIHDTIGVIHSHNTMSSFFSGTDDEYVNLNNGFSVVVNSEGDIKAVSRINLPCGSLIIKEAEVVQVNESDVVERLKEKIKERKYVSKGGGSSCYW